MDDVFERLRDIMQRSTKQLVVTDDRRGSMTIESTDATSTGKRRWFGAVQTTENDVSYHLMPVYEHPGLLDDVSPALRARLHGKSCFNFKTIHEDVFNELESLTRQSVADFEEDPTTN